MKTRAVVVPEYKFIYVEIPKAASGSIKDAIAKIIGLGTEGEAYLEWRKKTCIQNIDIDARNFSNYLTFTFVRNPFNRLVSSYHRKILNQDREYPPEVLAIQGSRIPKIQAILSHIKEKLGKTEISFDEFIYYLRDSKDDELDGHWRPQHTFISSKGLLRKIKIYVDFIGKVENMDEDWNKVCRKIGIKEVMPHTNRNPAIRGAYMQYYTPETFEIVTNRYKEDIQLFGYESEIEAMRKPS
jgi:hypothetical protein